MKAKILIVEDESIVALDLRNRLERLGYEVVGIADSGDTAFATASSTRPDLALMDIHLKGGQNGIETAQILREEFGIPVIYLTAYADPSTLERAKITEPYGYLVKPFNERELYSNIEMARYKATSERRLRESAARLERLTAAVPEGIVLIGADDRIESVNDAGIDYLAVLSGAGVGDVITALGKFTLSELKLEYGLWKEITVERPDPAVFEVCATPMDALAVYGDGAPTEWVLVIRDVTRERDVVRRVQIQDRLASVGQFAAGMAHDFNNLLTTIILSTQMLELRETSITPAGRGRLELIRTQAKRASELIRQVLDFSRAAEAELTVFDLQPVLDEFAEMLLRVLPENVKLEIVHTDRSVHVIGDSTRVLQVLMNLALNARDAMPDGGTLRIEIARAPHGVASTILDGTYADAIRIRVSDTGTGIPQNLLPRIFDPFFTTKGPDKGTGLGLAQVYGIVKHHGGHIEVTSEVGTGTTFTIYFAAATNRSSADRPAEPGGEVHAIGNRRSVLVIEDNVTARQSLRDVLELADFHVLTASNGREALNLLVHSSFQVDLIVTDLIMPEMGGLDLIRELSRKGYPAKIIVFTGYAPDDVMKELRTFRIEACILKPVDVIKLLKFVSSALDPALT